MGHELYREIRDGDIGDWTPAERLIAMLIADDANERTRQSWIPMQGCWRRGRWRDGLTEQSGLKPSAVKKALQRLSSRGYEFRIPHGTGRDGRPVFAAKGHSLNFRVPAIPERPEHQRGDGGLPYESQRGDGGLPYESQRGDGGPAKGGPWSPPSPQNFPSLKPLPSITEPSVVTPTGGSADDGSPSSADFDSEIFKGGGSNHNGNGHISDRDFDAARSAFGDFPPDRQTALMQKAVAELGDAAELRILIRRALELGRSS